MVLWPYKEFDVTLRHRKFPTFEENHLGAMIPNNGNFHIQIQIFSGSFVLIVPLFGVQTKKYHLIAPYKYKKILIFFTECHLFGMMRKK